MTVDMSDFNRAIARYDEKINIAKKMLINGADVQFIVKTTGLPEAQIRELK